MTVGSSASILEQQVFCPEKLKSTIFYFLVHANNSTLGKTKLMKLLYYADFNHMEQYRWPITGATYLKLPQGPVPIEALDMLDDLATSREITVSKVQSGPHFQNRYVPNAHVDFDSLSSSERFRCLSKLCHAGSLNQ